MSKFRYARCHKYGNLRGDTQLSGHQRYRILSATISAIISLTLIIVLAGCAGVGRVANPPFLMSQPNIDHLKQQFANDKALSQRCDKLRSYNPNPQSTLNWPKHYTSTGHNAPTPAQRALQRDSQASYVASLCYLATGEDGYLAVAKKILTSWAEKLTQVVGEQAQDDVNFNLPSMIIAAIWIGWDSDRSGTKEAQAFKRLITTVVLPKAELDNPNNHGAWAVLLQASAGKLLGRPAVIKDARERWLTLVAGMIDDDGVFTREVTRSATSDYHGGPTKGERGLAYTNFAIEPLALAAQIFDVTGNPVWGTTSGVKLGKAVEKAATWALDPSSFPYYKGTAGVTSDSGPHDKASDKNQIPGSTDVGYLWLVDKHYRSDVIPKAVASIKPTADRFMLSTIFG